MINLEIKKLLIVFFSQSRTINYISIPMTTITNPATAIVICRCNVIDRLKCYYCYYIYEAMPTFTG